MKKLANFDDAFADQLDKQTNLLNEVSVALYFYLLTWNLLGNRWAGAGEEEAETAVLSCKYH